MTLSKLFDWYRGDFSDWPLKFTGKAPGSPLAFVAEYLTDDRRAQLHAACGPALRQCDVDHFDYDWSLNRRR